MTDKAYIVANKQQEKSLLAKLEQQGCSWNDTENTPPTEWHLGRYPYAIFVKYGKKLVWGFNVDVSEVEIACDGRKEEQMSDKYVVSQEFMNELKTWKRWKNALSTYHEPCCFIGAEHIKVLPDIVNAWWRNDIPDGERNNRLIAILRWVNGEDVFEIEKPKKWVVRSKEPQGSVDGEPLYIWFVDELTLETETEATMPPYIRRFNTKEEAQSWANAHQEVVEVEE